jgi:hypothetical protein
MCCRQPSRPTYARPTYALNGPELASTHARVRPTRCSLWLAPACFAATAATRCSLDPCPSMAPRLGGADRCYAAMQVRADTATSLSDRTGGGIAPCQVTASGRLRRRSRSPRPRHPRRKHSMISWNRQAADGSRETIRPPRSVGVAPHPHPLRPTTDPRLAPPVGRTLTLPPGGTDG